MNDDFRDSRTLACQNSNHNTNLFINIVTTRVTPQYTGILNCILVFLTNKENLQCIIKLHIFIVSINHIMIILIA